MTSITSLVEKMVAFTGMVENVLQKMKQQDDSIAQISGRRADKEHRARTAEGNLKEVEAPSPSKMGDGTSYLSPHKASSSSHGPTRNTVEIPIIPIDGMIPAAQLKEYILGEIKGHEDREAPSYTSMELEIPNNI
ncbi:hypothetical protein LIER_00206 [Lithospermum erythrorhizon]|uniref:Uncharacterized protein n=1 Tax=Lithospermum erythrorhizon TaxID=34254 RepID=A0AAV3NL71_LITER